METERIDVLFSDVIMPGGMSGYDLSAWVRTNQPRIRVLLTSGFPEEKVAGESASMTQVDVKLLSKPYRKEDLADALRTVLTASNDAVAWRV
jgi:CheY-like chemotaxis protein